MNRNIKIAFAEVDEVLNLMDEQYQNKIPENLRKLISENKALDYNIAITQDAPLTEQKISRKALSILAVLNYKFWCAEEEKEKLIQKYKENEIVKQKELRIKYNPNNIFDKQEQTFEKTNKDNQLIVYNKKENVITKIISNIKRLLKLT